MKKLHQKISTHIRIICLILIGVVCSLIVMISTADLSLILTIAVMTTIAINAPKLKIKWRIIAAITTLILRFTKELLKIVF